MIAPNLIVQFLVMYVFESICEFGKWIVTIDICVGQVSLTKMQSGHFKIFVIHVRR